MMVMMTTAMMMTRTRTMPLDRWCQLGGCRHHRRTSLNLMLDQLCIVLSSPLCKGHSMHYALSVHYALCTDAGSTLHSTILTTMHSTILCTMQFGGSTHYALSVHNALFTQSDPSSTRHSTILLTLQRTFNTLCNTTTMLSVH